MCGIAGFIRRDGPADESLLGAMCAEMVHRGPDDEGRYTDGNAAIGMRRLSIIDLESGRQPIHNEDRSVWIVFNGEIYNFGALRSELISRGHRFYTASDTETIVHLYEDYGTAAFDRLRGMFALAIWDKRTRRLILARDRFGKKPLYYATTPEGFWFASELKCFRPAGIPFELDRDALRLYFRFSYIPEPRSVFRQVKKVEPGGWLIRGENGELESGRYWTVPITASEPAPGLSRPDLVGRIRTAFDESVRLRMIADVPLGAFLSGGIDSGSIVASMAMQSGEAVKTFSVGFEEADFNELGFASQVAKRYGTDHHEILVRPSSLEMVARVAEFQDEPFGDTAAIPTFIVSEFARRHVKVVLSGDGGDELFGGYDSFFEVDRRRRFDRLPQLVRRAVSSFAAALPWSARGKNFLYMASRPSPLARYFETNYAPFFLRQNLLHPDWADSNDSLLRELTADPVFHGAADIVSQAMYFEATANLAGGMLVKVDRMSMANSIEVRCPLLDHELAALAAQAPWTWHMNGGRGKRLLVEAVGDRLPAEILNRPKMGFGFPLAHWFRGPLRAFLRDHLLSVRARERGITCPEFVLRLIEEHEHGRRDNSQWLWTLLMFELWMQSWESDRWSARKFPTTLTPQSAAASLNLS